MPPFIIEASFGVVLITAIIRLTTTVNRIEAQQQISHMEIIGRLEVQKVELDQLKNQYAELKQEIKETRRHRYSDSE